MKRRMLLIAVLGAAGASWGLSRWRDEARQVQPLAIDPEGEALVYRDGWIESR